jgi:hypothetical protein
MANNSIPAARETSNSVKDNPFAGREGGTVKAADLFAFGYEDITNLVLRLYEQGRKTTVAYPTSGLHQVLLRAVRGPA